MSTSSDVYSEEPYALIGHVRFCEGEVRAQMARILSTRLGKLFKTPLQFRLARTSNCHAGQIAVTSLLKGTFEELPIVLSTVLVLIFP